MASGSTFTSGKFYRQQIGGDQCVVARRFFRRPAAASQERARTDRNDAAGIGRSLANGSDEIDITQCCSGAVAAGNNQSVDTCEKIFPWVDVACVGHKPKARCGDELALVARNQRDDVSRLEFFARSSLTADRICSGPVTSSSWAPSKASMTTRLERGFDMRPS